MFPKKIKIVFTQDFYDRALGNVWIGRRATVTQDQAKKFISCKQAEIVRAADVEEVSQPQQNTPARRGRGRRVESSL